MAQQPLASHKAGVGGRAIATGGGAGMGGGSGATRTGRSICGGGTDTGGWATRPGRCGGVALPRQVAAAALRKPSTACAPAPPLRAACRLSMACAHAGDFSGSTPCAAAAAAMQARRHARAIPVAGFADLSDTLRTEPSLNFAA